MKWFVFYKDPYELNGIWTCSASSLPGGLNWGVHALAFAFLWDPLLSIAKKKKEREGEEEAGEGEEEEKEEGEEEKRTLKMVCSRPIPWSPQKLLDTTLLFFKVTRSFKRNSFISY